MYCCICKSGQHLARNCYLSWHREKSAPTPLSELEISDDDENYDGDQSDGDDADNTRDNDDNQNNDLSQTDENNGNNESSPRNHHNTDLDVPMDSETMDENVNNKPDPSGALLSRTGLSPAPGYPRNNIHVFT